MPEPRPRVTLRPATPEDCRHLWKWRNEEATREASFQTDFIHYENHRRWFSSKLQDTSTRIFIVLGPQGNKVGYVRFKLQGPEAEISLSVDRRDRGAGYGPAAIKHASDHILGASLAKRIVARVKANNHPSVTAFQRAGFVAAGMRESNGIQYHRLVYGPVPEEVSSPSGPSHSVGQGR